MRVGILCKNKTMAHVIMYVDILNNRLLEESLFSQRFYWPSDKMFHDNDLDIFVKVYLSLTQKGSVEISVILIIRNFS